MNHAMIRLGHARPQLFPTDAARRSTTGSASTLTPGSLRALLAGDLLAVQELDFLPEVACRQIEVEHDRIIAQAPALAAAYGFATAVTYTGPPLHDFEERPDDYFALTALARQTRAEQGPTWQRAVDAVLARLSDLHDGEVRRAVQGDRGATLFTGILRSINHAAYAHTDFVPETLQGNWDLKDEIVDQFGLNVYVTDCTGGDVTVYDRREMPGDTAWRPRGSNYGVDDAMLHGVRRVAVPPTRGSFAIINTRRYHKIDPIARGSRTTISMFLGLTRDGSLLVWA